MKPEVLASLDPRSPKTEFARKSLFLKSGILTSLESENKSKPKLEMGKPLWN